jgi:hypothetical protein
MVWYGFSRQAFLLGEAGKSGNPSQENPRTHHAFVQNPVNGHLDRSWADALYFVSHQWKGKYHFLSKLVRRLLRFDVKVHEHFLSLPGGGCIIASWKSNITKR